jgi:hypothetical protein
MFIPVFIVSLSTNQNKQTMKKRTLLDRIGKQANELSALITGQKTTYRRKDARTTAQVAHRIQFHNLMRFAHMTDALVRQTYPVKPQKTSAYNMFIKYNLGRINVYLDKDEVDQKAVVVAPYNISQGLLPSIETTPKDGRLVTSLRVPAEFSIAETTTLGDVSDALKEANNDLYENDKFRIVHLVQKIVDDVPQVIPQLYEFTLNSCSAILFHALIPDFLFHAEESYIGTGAGLESGGVAYIRCREAGNKTLVSTQAVVLTPDNTMYEAYSSAEKRREAVESYGAPEKDYYCDPHKKREEEGEEKGKKEKKKEDEKVENSLSPLLAQLSAMYYPAESYNISNGRGGYELRYVS